MRSKKHMVCDKGYRHYVTLLIPQDSPRQVALHPAQHADITGSAPEYQEKEVIKCSSVML